MPPKKGSRRKPEDSEPEIEGNTPKVPAQKAPPKKPLASTKTRGTKAAIKSTGTEPTRGEFIMQYTMI